MPAAYFYRRHRTPAPLATVPLHARLVEAADHVIDGYRQSSEQQPDQFDWAKAKFSLRRALQIDPSDLKAKGRLALCNAYLNLVRNPKLPQAALSLDEFREAEAFVTGVAGSASWPRAFVCVFVPQCRSGDYGTQGSGEIGLSSRFRERRRRWRMVTYSAPMELLRAKYTVPKNAGAKWVAMAKNDVQRARILYKPARQRVPTGVASAPRWH